MTTDHIDNAIFKQCPLCKRAWNTREEFLDDKDMFLNGHQMNKRRVKAGLPSNGLLIFTHTIAHCGTSLAVAAAAFRETLLESRQL
jgi:hypothetical protein